MGSITIVGEDGGIPEEKVEISSPESLAIPFTPELQMKAIASVMGIENASELTKYEDKLETLLEYAKLKTKENSIEGLKWALRDLGDRLNTPTSGEKMIDYMTRYAYLELESIRIDQEKKRFKK